LVLSLAFLAAQVIGLHTHVSDGHAQESIATSDPGTHADHPGSHPISAYAVDHFSAHASSQEYDTGGDVGLLVKVPAAGLMVLYVVFWLALVLLSRAFAGIRVPFEWLRPPPIRRWPTRLLPPSQGPPRAA
jgi:hypothetical protein